MFWRLFGDLSGRFEAVGTQNCCQYLIFPSNKFFGRVDFCFFFLKFHDNMEVFETINMAEVPHNNPGHVLETLGDLSGRF